MEKPNNSKGPTSRSNQDRLALGYSKINFNNTFVGTTDPTYNGGSNSRHYMTNYINDIPNRRNNISKMGDSNNNTCFVGFCDDWLQDG